MADDRYRKDYLQHSHAEDRYSQPPPQFTHSQPHYPPPPPGEGAHRPSEDPRASMATSVGLPSMHDRRAPGYGPPSQPQGHGYPPDPRYASPNTTNGYPPPGQQSAGYLPPLQPGSDPRPSSYRPPEQYSAGRQAGPYAQDPQYPHHDPYYYRGPPQPPNVPANAYPYPPPQGQSGMPYHPEYAQSQGAGPQMAQAAPRQRTSIACKYCRKRKIRCSGYQSAPGGKCQNCARMNQECVFQPVSSSSSTAFIPVSAVPGGVPPGTPLYGAYGQPLAPQPQHPYPPAATGQQQQQQPPASYYPYPNQPAQPPHQAPQAQQIQAQQGPAQSPAESSYSYEGSQSGSRRRRRSSDDQEESYRLPPPRVGATEEEPPRRSPAEFSSKSSPGALGFPSFSRHSPRNQPLPQLATGANQGSQPPHEGRSPAGQNESSGASTPARQGQPASQTPTNQPAHLNAPAGQSAQQGSSVMSLSNLVEKNDIDKGMIDRLNRPRDPKAPK